MLKPMLGEAWHAMGSNKLRTALTMLGMVIGVGSVVLMMAIGQGAQYAVAQTISTMGSNLYVIIAGWTQSAGVRTGGGYGFTLRLGDAEAIGELDDIVTVAPVHQGTRQLIYGAKNWNAVVVGSTPSYLDARSWALASGSTFSDEDVRSATRVALLGKTVIENLFDSGEDPIGKTIRLQNTPFEVIGTLTSKGQNLDGRDQDDTIIIPLSTAQRKVFGVPFAGSVRVIMVKAASAEAMPLVEKSVTSLLRQRHRLRDDQDNDFYIRNLAAAADTAAETTRVMSMLLGAIASVSLLVGGIGIMNIMLVSVTERTREIGTRLAIGAMEREVLLQFLVEAVVVSSIGGLIGVLLAIGSSVVLADVLKVPFVLNVPIIIVAVLFSAAIGVIFGYFPARKAARLDPIEALRHE